MCWSTGYLRWSLLSFVQAKRCETGHVLITSPISQCSNLQLCNLADIARLSGHFSGQHPSSSHSTQLLALATSMVAWSFCIRQSLVWDDIYRKALSATQFPLGYGGLSNLCNMWTASSTTWKNSESYVWARIIIHTWLWLTLKNLIALKDWPGPEAMERSIGSTTRESISDSTISPFES